MCIRDSPADCAGWFAGVSGSMRHEHVSENCPRCGFPRCSLCHQEISSTGVMDFNCACGWPIQYFADALCDCHVKTIKQLQQSLVEAQEELGRAETALRAATYRPGYGPVDPTTGEAQRLDTQVTFMNPVTGHFETYEQQQRSAATQSKTVELL